MEIKDLGKFGLIERLTKNIVPQNASTQQGIGDDAAVLNYSNKEVLVTSKMFMEGVQFDLTYIDMEHLAYKVAMATMSNIFAMNGTSILLVGIPNHLILVLLSISPALEKPPKKT